MSTVRARVAVINNVRPHPDPEIVNLVLADIDNWPIVTSKDKYKSGDKVAYFEQGLVIPQDIAEQLNIVNYLSNKTDMDGNKVLVCHRIKLKGYPSYGIVMPLENNSWEVGQDLTDYYQVFKYNPPLRFDNTDAVAPDPRFQTYTDMENMRSYNDVFQEGEEVELSLKLHGTSHRIMMALEDDNSRTVMCGSKKINRRRPDEDKIKSNVYWMPYSLDSVKNLLNAVIDEGHKHVQLFGEVFGGGIQKGHDYGSTKPMYRAFDLMIDGQYVDRSVFYSYCELHGVDTAPIVYRGPFSLATVESFSNGDAIIGGDHGREGVVCRPMVEQIDPRVGRKILKWVGDSFLFSKASKHDTTDQ